MSDAPQLTEAPQEATAALEAALRGCPKPTYFGEYAFATYEQQEQLSKHLYSRYLTELEFKWVLFMRVYLDVATADKVIKQLASIVEYRRASGAPPAPNAYGCYFPEQNSLPRKPKKSRP